MKISQEFLDESRRKGREGETLFAACCSSRGLKFIKSTKNEDMYSHIDGYATDGSVSIAVDVKGAKERVCLEFKNVRGNDGWLYGKASQIAFLSPDKTYFLLVPRVVLMTYAESFMFKPIKPTKELYYLYSRIGRDDIMTFCTFEDLHKLENTKIWKI